jgi:hypothetical protein
MNDVHQVLRVLPSAACEHAIMVATTSLRGRSKMLYNLLRGLGAREEIGCGIQQQEAEGAFVRCAAQ